MGISPFIIAYLWWKAFPIRFQADFFAFAKVCYAIFVGKQKVLRRLAEHGSPTPIAKPNSA